MTLHDFDQLNLVLGTLLAVIARPTRPDGPIEAIVDQARGGAGELWLFVAFDSGVRSGVRSVVPDTVRLQTATDVTGRLIVAHNPHRHQAEYLLERVRAGSVPEFCLVEAAGLAVAARESMQTGSPVDLAG